MRTAIAVALMACMLTGCAGVAGIWGQPAPGLIFAKETGPLMVTDNEAPDTCLEGRATATSYFGLVGMGDGGIHAAMADGGIKKIHHVDIEKFNILNLYATYTVVVYGE